jgi:hypothetical protein
MKKTAQTTFIRNIGRGLALLLSFLVVIYGVRMYQIEAAREYSQEGVLRVLIDTVPEIEMKKVNARANGIGCYYPWRLKHCVGIELSNAANTIPNLSQRFVSLGDNFCSIVEKKYGKESYAPESRPRVHEVYLDLNHAYFTYFDCRNSRKPIGEIWLYISNESKLSGDAKKAKIIAKL